jgi:hypothetical protein
MKTFKRYILRPLFLIVICSLIFSFIAGTPDWQKWNIWLRFFYVLSLLYAFIVTDTEI